MDASKQMKSQNFMFLELAASFLELSCRGVGAWARGVYYGVLTDWPGRILGKRADVDM